MPTAQPTPAQLADDLALLGGAGFDLSKAKSDVYIHRLAQSYRKQQSQGRTPARKELRGHRAVPVSHLSPSGHKLEQWQISKPRDRDLEGNDFANLVRRAPTPTKARKGAKPDYLVIIKGRVSRYPLQTISTGETKPMTISVHVSISSIKKLGQLLKGKHDPAELLHWVEMMYAGVDWVQIDLIGFAYPEYK